MRNTAAKSRKSSRVPADEILPEYEFRTSRPNKYAAQYSKGSLVVSLDPDVAETFSSAEKANDALRALAGIIRTHKSQRARAR